MDPNGAGTLLQTYRGYFKRARDHTVIVSPSLWLCCYVPFGMCLLTSFYTGWFETNGNRFECLEVHDFTMTRVNTECFYESFILPELGYRGTHPGVGSPSNTTRNYRKELPVVQPMIFCFGFVFLVPLILWKYFLGGRAVYEVTSTLDDELTSRNEDYHTDANRKLKVFLDAFEVNYRRRHTLWLSMLFCKIMTPAVTILVSVCMTQIMGDELKWYGVTAFQRQDQTTWELVPVDALFPIMVQCGLRRVQRFGLLTEFETTCYFPRNTFYRIIFIAFWWLFAANVLVASLSAFIEVTTFMDPVCRQFSARKLVPKDLWEPLDACLGRLDLAGYVYFMLVFRNIEPVKARRVIYDVVDVT